MLSVKAKPCTSSDNEVEESPKEAVLRVSILFGAIIVGVTGLSFPAWAIPCCG